jgi:hypothetical protein
MATGLTAASAIYLNTYFWELTSDRRSRSSCSRPSCPRGGVRRDTAASRRLGKKRAAIIVSLAAIVVLPMPVALRLVGAFPPNGAAALVPILLVLNTTGTALFIMSSILTSSMVADIVEDSEVATGRRSEGVFVAANSFVQKTVSGSAYSPRASSSGRSGFRATPSRARWTRRWSGSSEPSSRRASSGST